MDEKTNEIINAILKRGNDVQIQRKGDGYIVLEVSRMIRAVNICGEKSEIGLTN